MLPLLLVSEWIMTNSQSPMTNVIKVLFDIRQDRLFPYKLPSKYLQRQEIVRAIKMVYTGDNFDGQLDGSTIAFYLTKREGEQLTCILETLGYEVVVESCENYYYSPVRRW